MVLVHALWYVDTRTGVTGDHKKFARTIAHNKCPRLVKLLPLNYSIYKHKKKVISTWHKDFSFPDPPKIEDSTMANTTDAALNIFTITQPNFPIPLQFDS